MRHPTSALALLAALALAACQSNGESTDTAAATPAEGAATATAGMGDADRTVAGGGIEVDGWKGKVDARARGQGKTTADSRFAMNGGNIDLKVGPAAIYWSDANTASGNYEVKSTFTERSHNPGHPHSYGLFIGGADLETDQQSLAYCIVYADGTYSVKYFSGATVETVVDRAASPAVRKADANGTASNEIGWRVRDGNAACVINGTEVRSIPSSQLVGQGKLKSLDGTYGVRVSHNLDVSMTPIVMNKL